MIKAIVIASLVAMVHSFYPPECCGDKDCSPIPAEHVQITPAGYVIDGWTIPFSQAKTSPDEQYHACVVQSFVLHRINIKCFWAPKGST